MPLPPQPRRPARTPGNPSLTNGDQIVTKVDKTDHRQPPPQPQTPAKHGAIATAPATLSTPAANPSGASRTNLNNPEQIRTNPNIAERPDQIGTPPGPPPNAQKKTTLNTEHRRSRLAAFHPPPNLPPSRGEVRWGSAE